MKSSKKLWIAFGILLVLSAGLTIFYFANKKEEKKIECPKEETFEPDKTYYHNLTFLDFKNLIHSTELNYVAIGDNSTFSYELFKLWLNKRSFYEKKTYYYLELSQMQEEDEIAFFEYDERLKDYDPNYILAIKNGKILTITEISDDKIEDLLEIEK